MIEKMKFVSITGPYDDIERMAKQYLSKYEIQLENAMTELKTVRTLRPYTDRNPYEELLHDAKELIPMGINLLSVSQSEMGIDEAVSVIQELKSSMAGFLKEREELQKTLSSAEELRSMMEPFQNLDADIHQTIDQKYISAKFGRMPKEFFTRFERYVYNSLQSIFFETHRDKDFVWGIYYAPSSVSEKVDAVYASMHFEQIYLPDKFEGTGRQAYAELVVRCAEISKSLETTDMHISEYINEHLQEISDAIRAISVLEKSFNIRKYAAITQERSHVFYILCGWMPTADADAFQKDIQEDQNVFLILEDTELMNDKVMQNPPTKMKNPRIFKPFEMYVRMYGLPAYNEPDPTIFLAITYSFIFGVMFGDVGQGLLLLIGGLVLYKLKGIDLAAIVSCAGFFSVIFGFMYGSFFGFEDHPIRHLWLQPKEAMVTLPIVGTMNTVFVVAIAFGMFMIIVAMIRHILMCFKADDPFGAFLDSNGVAGIVFYGTVAGLVVLFMSGHKLPATIISIVLIVLSVLCMAFKEPIEKAAMREKDIFEGGLLMYLVQTFFELFDVMLSYFSNTLSFVRVGAFAVSHAAMMEVVMMLAGAENGGTGNIAMIIFGNLFVCALEGLLVGIQVLRLQYYELFSRYYKGNGREFKPYKINQ